MLDLDKYLKMQCRDQVWSGSAERPEQGRWDRKRTTWVTSICPAPNTGTVYNIKVLMSALGVCVCFICRISWLYPNVHDSVAASEPNSCAVRAARHRAVCFRSTMEFILSPRLAGHEWATVCCSALTSLHHLDTPQHFQRVKTPLKNKVYNECL